MIHVLCYVMTTCNLRLGWIPDTGRTRTRQVHFSCFAFASVSVTGEWEREGRERWDQTQRCSREGGGGRHIQGSRDQGRRNLALSHPFLHFTLPSFHFVTRTPELRVSQGRSLPGGIERSARFRSALAFVYNDLTSLCVIDPQAIFLPFRSL